MALTMDLYGVTGMTNEARTYYELQLLTRAVPMMLHTGWGLQKDIPNNMGQVLNFRRFERPASVSFSAGSALTEGTVANTTNMTVATVNVSVIQFGAFDRVSDVLLSQGIDDVMAGLSGAFGEQMGVSVDVVCRDVLISGTNAIYAGNATVRSGLNASQLATGGFLMSATLIKRAAQELQNANARPLAKAGGNYVAFIHPDIWSDLFNDTLIQNALQYGGLRGDTNPLFTGSIFDYAGIRLQRTANARIFASNAASGATATFSAVYATPVIGEEAYGEVKFSSDTVRLIVKGVGSAGALDPLNQFGTVGWKASYNAAILNQVFIQRIETLSSVNRNVSNATP